MTEKHQIHPLSDEVLREIKLRLGTHSVFAPSSSHMWATCAGSLIPNLLAEDSAGYDAAEGTVAHGVAEEWLETDERPDHLVGTHRMVEETDDWFRIPITNEMLDYLEQYVSWVWGMPGEHYIETRGDFSDLTPIPDQSGTADHAVCSMGLLVVTDLKYGAGVEVAAAEDLDNPATLVKTADGLVLNGNPQALLYAYAFFRKWDHKYRFKKIVIRIAQPRMDNWSVWETTREELLKFAAWIKVRAAAAWKMNAPRTPSPKACRFCKVKATCGAHIVAQARMTDGMFDDLDAEITPADLQEITRKIDAGEYRFLPVDPMSLSTAQMAALLPWRGAVENWWKDLAMELTRRCDQGVTVPGYYMAEGRSSRAFRNPARAARHLRKLGLPEDKIFKKTMISPAQAETELLALKYKRTELPELLSPVVRKSPGRPVMVPCTDRRPPLSSAYEDIFEDLDDVL